jgi:hypothetical protein
MMRFLFALAFAAISAYFAARITESGYVTLAAWFGGGVMGWNMIGEARRNVP